MRFLIADPIVYYRSELGNLCRRVEWMRENTSMQYEEILDEVQIKLGSILDSAPREDGTAPLGTTYSKRDAEAVRIIECVAARCNVPALLITGPRRQKNITHARHLAMLIVSMRTTLTLDEIGRCFGGRDHSTVLYAINKVKKWQNTDRFGVRDDIEWINSALDSTPAEVA